MHWGAPPAQAGTEGPKTTFDMMSFGRSIRFRPLRAEVSLEDVTEQGLGFQKVTAVCRGVSSAWS